MNDLSKLYLTQIEEEKQQILKREKYLTIGPKCLGKHCEYKKTTMCKFYKVCMKEVLQDGSILEYLKKQYQKIKMDTKDYKDITKRLDEVMDSGIALPGADAIERSINDVSVGDKVDFDMILSSIPKGVINEKAFTKKTKELINQLSFIYKIDTLKMIELIRSILNEFGMIDKNALRLQARRMYQFNNGALPTLIYRSQPEYLKSPAGDTSMRGKIIAMFESINPVDFLRNKYGGTKPTNRDIKIIESLVIDLEMPPAVVNVLLDYVLRKNNNKLATNYIETIAGQWKRAGLKNATEAMNFAEKENKKYTKKFDNEKVTKEPVWFNKVEKIEEMSDADKEELENLLTRFEQEIENYDFKDKYDIQLEDISTDDYAYIDYRISEKEQFSIYFFDTSQNILYYCYMINQNEMAKIENLG